MDQWRRQFRIDPVPPLLASASLAVNYWTRRDLLDGSVEPASALWDLPEARRMVGKQSADGSWRASGARHHPAVNPQIIETWRYLRCLVQQYGFDREQPCAFRACEYLFAHQTADGDLRGILGNQYATYYTGAIAAVLIEAGYADDPRIDRALDWLLAMRQDDGGWSIPLITHRFDRATQYHLTTERVDPVEPDRTRPFSHNWTGMALRAFAAHPRERASQAAADAARLLKGRFFQPDCFTSYQAAGYWLRFEYPFWWNNLVAALDSLSLIGLTREDPDVGRALAWLVDHQQEDGLWRLNYAKDSERETAMTAEMKLWVSLAICRVFRRLYDQL
jgi:hypothetical protein